MKKCTCCGRKFPDEATVCAIDQTALVAGKVASTFGTLSIAAPFIGALLIFMLSPHYDSIENVFLVLAASSLSGFVSAIVAWRRREHWVLWSIGLLLNLGPLAMALALLTPGSQC